MNSILINSYHYSSSNPKSKINNEYNDDDDDEKEINEKFTLNTLANEEKEKRNSLLFKTATSRSTYFKIDEKEKFLSSRLLRYPYTYNSFKNTNEEKKSLLTFPDSGWRK